MPPKRSNFKKPVTLDEYRNDRDYWKHRAKKQQHVINTIEHHKNRLENALSATENSLAYFRQALKEVCPHDKLDPKRTSFDKQVYCDRCKNYVVVESS